VTVAATGREIAVIPAVRAPRGASVRIAQDAHPDRAAHVAVGEFDGPLALLLSLIEQRQLDVLTVSLGDLATAFLDALVELTADQLAHISAFIAVAAQLILIKSRALLPRPPVTVASDRDEGPDPEEALRRRLIEYRRYRDAAARIAGRVELGMVLYHREPGAAVASGRAGARPAPLPRMDPTILATALDRALRVVPPPPPPPEVMRRTVTLEERAAVIRRALRRAPAIVLQELLRGARDRVVVAVTFLAMLEMAKAREVSIEQDEPWGPIVCRRIGEPGGSA
jgi:segregation and condensation protein A